MGILANSEQQVKLPSLLLWRKKYNMEFIIWCLLFFFGVLRSSKELNKFKHLNMRVNINAWGFFFLCSLGFYFGRPK